MTNLARSARRRPQRPPRSKVALPSVVAIGSLLVLAIVVTTGQRPENADGFPKASSPDAILRELAARYQSIARYEDRTLMRLRDPAGGRWLEEGADLLVRFVRPDKLRLQVSRGVNEIHVLLV